PTPTPGATALPLANGMAVTANVSASPTAVPTGTIPQATTTGTPLVTPTGNYREYITKEGDNLLTIAENELGDSNRWGEVQKLNMTAIQSLGGTGQYFPVGTKLLLPK
ncbi:MAG: hypothetical protein Q4G59_10940, partial [Planctomycetia bacterium]|nr:hypothetical protein [Planctomycetia bacterium]